MHFKYCFNVVFLYHSFLVLTVKKKKISRKTAENEQTLFIYTSTESVYISTVFRLIRTHQYGSIRSLDFDFAVGVAWIDENVELFLSLWCVFLTPRLEQRLNWDALYASSMSVVISLGPGLVKNDKKIDFTLFLNLMDYHVDNGWGGQGVWVLF